MSHKRRVAHPFRRRKGEARHSERKDEVIEREIQRKIDEIMNKTT